MIKSARKVSLSSPELRRSRDVRPEALVAFVKDANEWDATLISTTPLRDQVGPLADWIEIDLGPISPTQRQNWLKNELSSALRDRQMHSLQLVILSFRSAARVALDLILQRALSCVGIVAVDVPCAQPTGAVSATAASIRIVLHERQHDPARARLIDALRQQDADIRLMMLPSEGSEACDITVRATAVFLSELTARACRQSTENGGLSHV
jgi:hypothetical protein